MPVLHVSNVAEDELDLVMRACNTIHRSLASLLPKFGCSKFGDQSQRVVESERCLWICRGQNEPQPVPNRGKKPRRDGQPEAEARPPGQFISLFSVKYKMTLFSAAVVEPEDTNSPRGSRGDWNDEMIAEMERQIDGLPTTLPRVEIDHFNTFSDYDRGHLFPFAFAKNKDQAEASMRLTNTVPQDSVFNKGVWSSAENYAKVQIQACHRNSGS